MLNPRVLNMRSKQQEIVDNFHFRVALAGLVLGLVCYFVFKLTNVVDYGAHDRIIALAVVAVVVGPALILLREKSYFYLASAILTVFWGFFYKDLLFYLAALAGRLGMGISLRDSTFVKLDQLLHLDIPALVHWSAHAWIGKLVNDCYPLLFPLMWLAVLLPIFKRRLKDAQHFIAANITAFILGLPLFALFPAVGPWYGYGLKMDSGEAEAQANLFRLRLPGTYVYHPPGGIICFPSFHVIWAILCAYALWSFKPLRIPVSLLAILIICSTLTSSEHYASDVIAGIPVAFAAIYLAKVVFFAERGVSRIAQAD